MSFIGNVVCPYCRRYTQRANVEHIIPKRRLSLLAITDAFRDANRTRACLACNSNKSDLLPHDPFWANNPVRVSITLPVSQHVARLIIRFPFIGWRTLIPDDSAWGVYLSVKTGVVRGNLRSVLLAARDFRG